MSFNSSPAKWSRYKTLTLLLFVFLQAMVVGIAYVIYQQQQQSMQHVFIGFTEDLQALVKDRLQEQALVLGGVRGLFHASNSVSATEFADYLDALELDRYDGLVAIGYAPYVRAEAVGEYQHQIKLEEGRELSLVVLKGNDAVMPIQFIGPSSKDNIRELDFDLLSERKRYEAINIAVSENTVVMSDVILQTSDETNPSSKLVLMLTPVYKKNMPLNTPTERWQAFDGIVCGTYQIESLMISLLSSVLNFTDLHIYSGQHLNKSSLLLDTRPDNIAESQAKFHEIVQVNHYQQIWTLEFFSRDSIESTASKSLVWLLITTGTLVNLSVIFILNVLIKKQQAAQSLVESMMHGAEIINEQLTFNEARLRLSLESSGMGVWNWYLESNFIQWDDSVRDVFGLEERDSLNTYEDFLALVHADDRQSLFEKFSYAIENKTPMDTVYRVVNKQGNLRYISTRAKIILNQQSKKFIMAGTCWDVTERKQHEKMKEEFVSVVSHELRTPLTVVSSVLALLSSGNLGALSDKAVPMLDVANKNVARLKVLINDLLDIEKILSGKMLFDMKPQPVLFLLEMAVDDNRAFAADKKIELNLVNNLSENNLKILVDSMRFCQILTNFISNAVKFSPENSQVNLLMEVKGDYIKVSVIDKGIGIPMESQPHLFEKFYQVDSSSSRQKGGAGLGLAISKELVERMGGTIGFTSIEGEGSCFYVEFRRA